MANHTFMTNWFKKYVIGLFENFSFAPFVYIKIVIRKWRDKLK